MNGILSYQYEGFFSNTNEYQDLDWMLILVGRRAQLWKYVDADAKKHCCIPHSPIENS